MRFSIPTTFAPIASGLIAALLVAGPAPPAGQGQTQTPPAEGPQAKPDDRPRPDPKRPAPDPKKLEPCGDATDFEARRDGKVVTVSARGSHRTAGFHVVLEPSPLRIFPPQFLLKHARPEGAAAQVITPFRVRARFQAGDEAVRAVIVHDAKGKHTVKVESGPSTPPRTRAEEPKGSR